MRQKKLPLPFNETERNGPFNETERAVHNPFFIRSSSVRGPCVFSVRFESVLIKLNVTVHAKTLRKSAILISRYRSRRHER